MRSRPGAHSHNHIVVVELCELLEDKLVGNAKDAHSANIVVLLSPLQMSQGSEISSPTISNRFLGHCVAVLSNDPSSALTRSCVNMCWPSTLPLHAAHREASATVHRPFTYGAVQIAAAGKLRSLHQSCTHIQNACFPKLPTMRHTSVAEKGSTVLIRACTEAKWTPLYNTILAGGFSGCAPKPNISEASDHAEGCAGAHFVLCNKEFAPLSLAPQNKQYHYRCTGAYISKDD